MNQTYTEFYSQGDPDIYQAETRRDECFDLEQVNQFQPEVEPRSTTTAMTDLYASSQIESHRNREQGDPNEYGALFQDQ